MVIALPLIHEKDTHFSSNYWLFKRLHKVAIIGYPARSQYRFNTILVLHMHDKICTNGCTCW